MTAKKIVISKGKGGVAAEGETKPAKQTRAVGSSQSTPKIDIGLAKVLPAEDAGRTGPKRNPEGAAGAGKADAAAKAPREGKTSTTKPRKPIVVQPAPSARKKEFRFLCNACGKKLQAPEAAAGQSTQCPDCENTITIPQPAAEPQTKKQQKRGVRYKKPKTFKFFCVRCGQSLEADRALAETQTECPHCRSVIVVPLPADD